MRFPDPLFRLFGMNLHFHWSCLIVPLLVVGQGVYATSWEQGLLNVGVLALFVFGIVIHELLQAGFARRLGIRTRDIFIYPVCGHSRLGSIAERPWGEMWIAFSGIVFGWMFVGLLTLMMNFNRWGFTPLSADASPSQEVFFNRLFWLQVLFAIINCLPTFPFDGAHLFRSALALTASRMRATEVATILGTVVALAMILLDILAVQNGLLGSLAVFVFVMSQYELALMKYFFELQHPQYTERIKQIGTVSLDQLIDPESRPVEENYTGFIWNPRTQLWIEWRDGQPVSASAILGE